MTRAGALRHAPTLVVLAGALFSASLVARIPGAVFTNGDLGVKFLMLRQFEARPFQVALHLPAPPWVEALWNEGLYPLEFPFLVERAGRRFAVFSFVFPWLCAPFHGLFGHRGLYVVPLASLWLVWLLVGRACRQLGCDDGTTALALAAVAFGSPLTAYGAMFWEHTPAVALALAGTLPLLTSSNTRRRAAFAGGSLLGAAPLLRNELLVPAALVGMLLAHAWLRGRPTWLRPIASAGLAGLAAATLAAAATQALAFGDPLGLHVRASAASEWTSAARGLRVVGELYRDFVGYFPAAFGAPLALFFLFRHRREVSSARAATLVSLGLAVALLVPPAVRIAGGLQWGPRYLLLAMPLLAIGAAVALTRARAEGRPWHRTACRLALALIAWGAWINVHEMSAWLSANYAGRMAAYTAVAGAPQQAVAVSHQFAAQQLADLVWDRPFFLTERSRDLRLLARVLRQRGIRDFLYVCHVAQPCVVQRGESGPHTFHDARTRRPLYALRFRAAADRYDLYDGSVLP